MSQERTITLRKRIAASKCKSEDGKPIQFLGSGFINRHKNGKSCSCSPDAMFVENILPDLKWDEGERGEVDVNCTISLDPFDGAVQMWCFGRQIQSRSVTPYKPILIKTDNNPNERDRADTYKMRGSYMYLDEWCNSAYFEQIPAGDIFPVYVSVKRIDN